MVTSRCVLLSCPLHLFSLVQSGNKNKITITNDTGRLSKSEIDRMVADAERFRDEDKKVQERASAKVKLDSFAHGLKQAVQDKKNEDKFSPTDRNTVMDAVRDVEKWTEEKGESAEKEEFEVRTSDRESRPGRAIGQARGGSSDSRGAFMRLFSFRHPVCFPRVSQSQYNELQSKCGSIMENFYKGGGSGGAPEPDFGGAQEAGGAAAGPKVEEVSMQRHARTERRRHSPGGEMSGNDLCSISSITNRDRSFLVTAFVPALHSPQVD